MPYDPPGLAALFLSPRQSRNRCSMYRLLGNSCPDGQLVGVPATESVERLLHYF